MSSDTGTPRTMGARELLDARERSWSARLRNASLVAEADIRAEFSKQVAYVLGRLYGKLPDQREAGASLLLRWPACVAAAMAGAAVTGYEAGTYWRALWASAEYPGTAQDQAIWGDAFIRAVAKLGMATFPEMPLRYVGPILMHAGIPAYCLGDYFRLLLDRRRQDPGMDAESFLSWATSPGRELRLSTLDMPARRFLGHGGDYAHDVVDRSLDLLERLSEPDPDLDGVLLPAYMVEIARDESAAGRLDLTAARRARGLAGHDQQPRPRIGLDPFGQGVQVILPAVGEAPDGVAIWRVIADGEAATIKSRALWVGMAEAAPETTHPLHRPVRTVLVSLAGRDLVAELQVVEPTDPILFFADDGRRLPASQSLPRGQVWVLHPADRDLVVTGDVSGITETAVPFGWDGWRLRLVSLENVQRVSLEGGRAHLVHGQTRPRLVLDDPVPGVTTPYGSPVYAAPPLVWLPGTPESPISWQVDVRPAAGGSPLASRTAEGPCELDVWEPVSRPILGAFDIIVRGPLGRGMRRTVFIAEGLAVSYQPAVRALNASGLRPCAADLTSVAGSAVFPGRQRFADFERAHIAEYRAVGESEALVVAPPHVALICVGAGATTWTAAPLRLTTETFGDAGRLLVRAPGLSEHAELEVWAGGECVQTIPASGQRSPGLAGYELARAGDTVAGHGRAELVLPFDGAPMPVGFVRPRRLATGAELDGDRLVIRDYVHVDGLSVAVHLVYAPWRNPVVLPVPADGVVVLPQGVHQAGPIRVVLRVEDPWTTTGWPTWPGPDSLFCKASGIPAGIDPEEDVISCFLARSGELPEPLRRPERVWCLVNLAEDLMRSGIRADLRERCGEALRKQPRAALLALLESGLDHRACVSALIMAGLASSRPESATDLTAMNQAELPAELTAAGQLWAALPAAAAVLTTDLLSRSYADATGPLAELADGAIAQCGDSLRRMLGGDSDPYAAVGRFGLEAEQMTRFSPQQLEVMWQAAAVVPKAFLDADTRTVAALRMFDVRRMPVFKRAALNAASVISTAERLVLASSYPGLTRQITARRHPHGTGGWLAVPAMSAALAIVGRLAARGENGCQAFERAWRGTWAGLATQAPDLVGIDLVLAEALIAGAEGSRLTEESA
jgi:hypothetical protein